MCIGSRLLVIMLTPSRSHQTDTHIYRHFTNDGEVVQGEHESNTHTPPLSPRHGGACKRATES